jgi:hypothetical protein
VQAAEKKEDSREPCGRDVFVRQIEWREVQGAPESEHHRRENQDATDEDERAQVRLGSVIGWYVHFVLTPVRYRSRAPMAEAGATVSKFLAWTLKISLDADRGDPISGRERFLCVGSSYNWRAKVGSLPTESGRVVEVVFRGGGGAVLRSWARDLSSCATWSRAST